MPVPVINWALLFQGISAASAIIAGARHALETKKLLKNEAPKIVEAAEKEAVTNSDRAISAAKEMHIEEKDFVDLLDKRLDKAKKRFIKMSEAASTPVDDADVLDRYIANVCSVLKSVKQVNGGKLPQQYQTLWDDNDCENCC